jgi:outer membrane lipoprotein-sorting protein
MKVLILFLSLFAFTISAFAQSPDKILKNAEKALGGAKNLRAVESWRKTGTIIRIRDGASGRVIEQTSQPSFYNLSYDFNGFETETGFNGKSGWRRDSREGLQTLTGKESRDFSSEADYRNGLWLDYKKDKSKIASGGRADVNGKSANVVRLTTAKGEAMKLYLDAATNLPLREEIPFGESLKIFDYSDYRTVGAVKIPFSVRLKDGENDYEIKIEDAKINQPIAQTEFDFPNISDESLPDIPQLLQSLQTNEDKVEGILDTYSYNQKIIRRELDKDGVLRETGSEIRQLSFYKGYRIARLVEKNDKPLSEKNQKSEDEDVQKRVAEIEKEIAKKEARAAAQAANATPDDEGRRVSVAEVLRASLLKNPRRERFRGRSVIVFDFEPNPNFDYKNAKSFLKFFGKTAGVMWIDAEDKQVARIEAVLADSFKVGGGVLAKLRKGASFMLEQERVGDEIWLPSTADINLSVRVLLVKGIDLNQVIKSYDYRKFNTEVKDAQVDEVKNPL